ncbi:MAG: GtrA family protein [Lachnospiraceae bacterium]|nr:GtrA family protein [Lachnospiraceae bacterium]MBO7599877.1 GtrA family protein [Lachnospiraceae bacterium]
MNKFWNTIENIIRFFIYKLFKLKLSEESFQKFMQFVRFAVVGLSNSLISYAVYMLCIKLGLHYQLANFLGFSISVVNAFYWSNKYVFTEGREERSLIKTFIKTYISYAGTGLVLAALLLILWVDILKLPEFVGPILNLCITVPLNFFINKFWAYRKTSAE